MKINNGNIKTYLKSLIGKVRLFFTQGYFQNRIVFWLLILSFIANLINWGIIFVFIRPENSSIILHYNVYFGVDMMGSWKSVFWLPAIGLILFFINIPLSMHFYAQKERIASHILLMSTFMVQLSLIIAAISVIIINY